MRFIPLIIILFLCVVFPACDKKSAPAEPVEDAFSGKTVEGQRFAMDLLLARAKNAPMTGETAPEGMVFGADGETGFPISNLWKEKPVVLVFGSASCTSFRLFGDDLRLLSEKYDQHFDFHFIYVREAHPEGGFQPNLTSDFAELKLSSVPDPTLVTERCALAETCSESLGDSVRLLSDGMDDSLAIQWAAWPARIFVVGKDGVVLYAGGIAPWYFKVIKTAWHDPPPPMLEEALRAHPFDEISLEAFLEQTVPKS